MIASYVLRIYLVQLTFWGGGYSFNRILDIYGLFHNELNSIINSISDIVVCSVSPISSQFRDRFVHHIPYFCLHSAESDATKFIQTIVSGVL